MVGVHRHGRQHMQITGQVYRFPGPSCGTRHESSNRRWNAQVGGDLRVKWRGEHHDSDDKSTWGYPSHLHFLVFLTSSFQAGGMGRSSWWQGPLKKTAVHYST
jgi:hypothetical protein